MGAPILHALAVALIAAALAPVAAGADGPAGGITVPSVTVPSVTVPPVSTPPVDVPPASTPVASTPPVHGPSVSTPAVTTPSVSVSPPTTPQVLPVAARPAPPRSPAAEAAAPPAREASVRTPAAARRTAARRVPARTPVMRRTEHARRTAAERHARRRRGATRARVASLRPAAVAPTIGVAGPARDEPRPQPGAARGGPARGPSLPGTIRDIAEALPRWMLAAFVGFALIAMLMAINAYLNARRARALGAQRAALLDDVGLLQTALLAPVPADAGDAHVSVAYRPAAGPAAGGDFYDVIALGAGRTGLLLGDVSGHGREALRHAALVRYTVRTFLAAGLDPADALARADECLDTDLDGHFATVIAGVYDHDTHALRYAKAGHHPPVIRGIAHDPGAEPIAPPLGAGLRIRPEACEVTLDPGATVCLFTDGLIEARRDGALLGRDTLVELLDRGCPDGPELLDRLVEHADEIRDDLAVCVLRRP
jgi:hypothetical protein